jgi:hypothetical protein
VSHLNEVTSDATKNISGVTSDTISQLDEVLSNAILSAYLLVFLAGLVAYAITSIAALRSVDSMLFLVCFVFVNTWISFRMNSNAAIALGVLFILFVISGR